ncbi:KxYKxGKxW signal peptide domain-containing protein [Weissella confusa]|uniref:KxYKxGKxW signal peptide domain-containing protein n=1 Tax=Weissella confusa TaxID=1583 RepID=UPI0018F11229|nr:KxYKxGKxW signal peptide domain-containing protein [Weissella confusa]MBJ7620815.1 KxYKxGKxW signal peptide domain-containing protein [Weissella confusa]MBJ7668148.1 KxYKxGKxW signal peptide domain-containing protein [Weissella confusa]
MFKKTQNETERTVRFKMYKDGKKWVTRGLSIMGVALIVGAPVMSTGLQLATIEVAHAQDANQFNSVPQSVLDIAKNNAVVDFSNNQEFSNWLVSVVRNWNNYAYQQAAFKALGELGATLAANPNLTTVNLSGVFAAANALNPANAAEMFWRMNLSGISTSTFENLDISNNNFNSTLIYTMWIAQGKINQTVKNINLTGNDPAMISTIQTNGQSNSANETGYGVGGIFVNANNGASTGKGDKPASSSAASSSDASSSAADSSSVASSSTASSSAASSSDASSSAADSSSVASSSTASSSAASSSDVSSAADSSSVASSSSVSSSVASSSSASSNVASSSDASSSASGSSSVASSSTASSSAASSSDASSSAADSSSVASSSTASSSAASSSDASSSAADSSSVASSSTASSSAASNSVADSSAVDSSSVESDSTVNVDTASQATATANDVNQGNASISNNSLATTNSNNANSVTPVVPLTNVTVTGTTTNGVNNVAVTGSTAGNAATPASGSVVATPVNAGAAQIQDSEFGLNRAKSSLHDTQFKSDKSGLIASIMSAIVGGLLALFLVFWRRRKETEEEMKERLGFNNDGALLSEVDKLKDSWK